MTPASGWIPGDAFLERVKRAYRLAITRWSGINHPFWGEIYDRQRPIQVALLAQNHDALRAAFINPGGNDLFYGVDNLFSEFVTAAAKEKQTETSTADEVRQLLSEIEAATGQSTGHVTFPNPFAHEYGLWTNRGLASYRAVHALYQARRLQQLLPNGGRILEIGPGMGRTAYFAYQLGLRDYSTIDLPMGVVGQACFLAATLGPDKIWMIGDDPKEKNGRIQLMPGSQSLPAGRFDLVLNVDSITEMSHAAALRYVLWMADHASRFLSINHNKNEFTASELCHQAFSIKRVDMKPYPLRDGYFEELIDIGPKRWAIGARYEAFVADMRERASSALGRRSPH